MWRESALLVILLFRFQQISATKHYVHSCLPSSCGKVTNITHPFRLKGDPDRCGDHRYELACENNVTILSLYSGKYHVQAINYNNFTIRVVDPGVRQSNCSSIPRYFLSPSNFSDTYNYLDIDMDAYQITQERLSEPIYFNHIRMYRVLPKPVSEHVVFMNCNHSVSDNGKYVDTATCVNWHSKGYTYAIAGDLISEDLEVGCNVKLVTPTSWWGLRTPQYSYSEMHKALAYGFEISWMNRACKDICANSMDRSCIWDTSGRVDCSPNCHRFLSILSICDGTPIWYQLLLYARDTIYTAWIGLVETLKGQKEFDDSGNNKLGLIIGHYVLPSFLLGKFFFGMTLFIALLIYKWKSRHLSMYENIENYLEHANLMPIRYSYKEIKKMTGGFKDKLGEGGYGSVFKGKLCSGPYVAIKMLGKSTGNGQDFISEVATIGRIHHQNIVKLVGFCVEGSKRALVYEFMPNGSLDKIIFSKDGNIHLSYDEIYHISIGIARGIAYLHHGCEMQIMHFDIKPHNILLDGKLTPKVSDFGLAKLYPIDNSVVTMTGARGTIGYMAPELFYNNIGRISQKADVYSFGMLLMEMTNKRKNLNPHAQHSSQLYFPFWIYKYIGKEKDIDIEDVKEEEKEEVKKMIIVALWCIQLKPNDRPTMSEVVKMLEGDIESLKIPPKPTLFPDETMSSDLSFTSSSNSSMQIAVNPYNLLV